MVVLSSCIRIGEGGRESEIRNREESVGAWKRAEVDEKDERLAKYGEKGQRLMIYAQPSHVCPLSRL